MEFLRERALQFLEMSKTAAERGFYELALFHAEQALQLYVKYLIHRRLSDFPKTHFLRDLLDRAAGGVRGRLRPGGVPAAPLRRAYAVGTCLHDLPLPSP
jgi:Uncharacterized conserved protein related to C-terminal domain of eukaryotic chaperone, SACSIN